MDKEQEIINRIVQILPKSDFLANEFFESDAEVLKYCHKNILFTIDDFSEEDFFFDDDGYRLGWNMAVCTISDILASGGKPHLFAHSLSYSPKKWDQKFLDQFAAGIADVLTYYEAGFIAGDLGNCENWHYTGVAIGRAHNPILRKGAQPGDIIYLTGQVGGGNMEAALKLKATNKLVGLFSKKYRYKATIRDKEADLINDYASTCIDTSDGVINALNTIAQINNTGYQIFQIPYLQPAKRLCTLLRKPCSILLFGECGEYELLCTVPQSLERKFNQEINERNLELTKVGEIAQSGIKTLEENGKVKDISDFIVKARNYDDINDYLDDLDQYVKSLHHA